MANLSFVSNSFVETKDIVLEHKAIEVKDFQITNLKGTHTISSIKGLSIAG